MSLTAISPEKNQFAYETDGGWGGAVGSLLFYDAGENNDYERGYV